MQEDPPPRPFFRNADRPLVQSRRIFRGHPRVVVGERHFDIRVMQVSVSVQGPIGWNGDRIRAGRDGFGGVRRDRVRTWEIPERPIAIQRHKKRISGREEPRCRIAGGLRGRTGKKRGAGRQAVEGGQFGTLPCGTASGAQQMMNGIRRGGSKEGGSYHAVGKSPAINWVPGESRPRRKSEGGIRPLRGRATRRGLFRPRKIRRRSRRRRANGARSRRGWPRRRRRRRPKSRRRRAPPIRRRIW